MTKVLICQAKRKVADWSKDMTENVEYFIKEGNEILAGPFKTEKEARQYD